MSIPRSLKKISFPALALFIVASLLVGCASREDRITSALKKSDAFLLESKPAEAIAILEKTIGRYPDSPELFEKLGTAHLVNSDHPLSIEAYSKAIELDLTLSDLWKKIADQEMRLGLDEEAIQSYESYLAANPNDFIAWKNVAELQEEKGRYSQAIKAAQEWQNLKPSARPAYQLGRLFYLSNNFAVARMWYTEATRHQQEQTAQEALATLIELETSVQQYFEAERLMAEYESRYGRSSSNPRIQTARSALALWKKRQSEIAQAAEALETEREKLERKTLEAEKREEEARQRRLDYASLEDAPPVGSRQIAQDGPSDDASQLFEDEPDELDLQASNSPTQPADQSTPPTNQSLAAAQEKFDAGDFQAAIDLYLAALGSNAENPNVWHQLALAYVEQRMWIDAEACIYEARRRAPTSSFIASTYIRVISNNNNLNRITNEAQTLKAAFPESSSVALAIAQALNTANAPATTVAQAYREFLAMANERTPGYQEAQRYLNR